MTVVYVALGGAIGSALRYLVGVLSTKLWPAAAFPYATLAVNIVGSFAMGLLVGALAKYTPEQQHFLRSFIAVGILGGFTTFSAFSLDTVLMFERGQQGLAIIYVGVSVVVSILALLLGLMVMRGAAA